MECDVINDQKLTELDGEMYTFNAVDDGDRSKLDNRIPRKLKFRCTCNFVNFKSAVSCATPTATQVYPQTVGSSKMFVNCHSYL